MKHNSSHSHHTRRSFLGAAAGVGAFGMSCASADDEAAENKTAATAFALIGDRYHNSDYIRTALTKTIVEGAGISVDFTDDYTSLNAETLAEYRMLIVFRDGFIWPNGYYGSYPGYGGGPDMPEIHSIPPLPDIPNEYEYWMQPHQGKAVKEFVRNGGAALFFHNNSHVSVTNEDYRDVEGAEYTGHPPVRDVWFRITDTGHPITQGVNDFLVTDEQHYVNYLKDPEYVFMRSENAEGLEYGDQGSTCEGGWAYDYGEGRVCFMAPGHMITSLWNPEYVKIQRNAAKWALKEM